MVFCPIICPSSRVIFLFEMFLGEAKPAFFQQSLFWDFYQLLLFWTIGSLILYSKRLVSQSKPLERNESFLENQNQYSERNLSMKIEKIVPNSAMRFSTSKEMTLFSKRKLFRPGFPQHMWYFLGKSLMGETMRIVREKNELETHNTSNLKAFFHILAFQDYKTRNKMIDFLKYSSTGVIFLTEWLRQKN